jgi:2-phospho-L-lactate guanylyltransferase (CobY/MobA/RfbA family)
VVPFRRASAKSRLPARLRAALAEAMLADVLAACREVGPTVLATAPAGLGAAVADALVSLPNGPVLVVNADVPAVTPRDLRMLLAAIPPDGLALVAAEAGTTNALALESPALFRPLYGPRSSLRFRLLAPSRTLDLPNLVDDVDTVADLRRLGTRAGRHTQVELAAALSPARRRSGSRAGTRPSGLRRS